MHAFYPCECSRYLLFSLGDAPARRWASVAPRPAPAGDRRWAPIPLPPARSSYIGLSFQGLQRLGLEPAVLDEFPDHFRNGPDHIALGDVGVSAPGPWRTAGFR